MAALLGQFERLTLTLQELERRPKGRVCSNDMQTDETDEMLRVLEMERAHVMEMLERTRGELMKLQLRMEARGMEYGVHRTQEYKPEPAMDTEELDHE